MSTKTTQRKPQLHERFQGVRLQIATAWGGAHGPQYIDIQSTDDPLRFTVLLKSDLHDKTEAEQKALRLLKTSLQSHKLAYVSHTHGTVVIEVPADWLPKEAGENLPSSEPTDDIGTLLDDDLQSVVDGALAHQRALQSAVGPDDMTLTTTSPDGTSKVLSFPGGTEEQFANWATDQIGTAAEPPKPETPAERLRRQYAEIKSTAYPGSDFPDYQTWLERQFLNANGKALAWEEQALESAAREKNVQEQLGAARAEVLRLDRQLAEKDGLQRAAEQNLLLAQQEITSLRNRNQVQERMLREATGQGGKVEVKTLKQFVGHIDGVDRMTQEEADAQLAEFIGQWGMPINILQELGNDLGGRSFIFVRPVQKPTASPDLTAERGIPAHHTMVRAIGQPVTIIVPPEGQKEPVLNKIDPDSYIARIRAASGDVDAVLAEDNTKNLTQAQAIGAAYVATNRPVAPPLPMLPARK